MLGPTPPKIEGMEEIGNPDLRDIEGTPCLETQD